MGNRIRALVLPAAVLAIAASGAGCSSSTSSHATAGGSASPTTGGSAAHGKFKWVISTSSAGIGDQGFNDLAYAGVKQAASALGGTASAIQATSAASYVPDLEEAVAEGASLTVAVGFDQTDAVVQVATEHPNSKFLLIDSDAVEKDGHTPVANVHSVTFKEQEAGYLAGVVAGLTTKTNKLALLGGQQIPPVERYFAGFEAGVKSVNASATLQTSYVGSFGDAAKGEELASGIFTNGVDILFESAGGSALGAYKAAAAKGPGVWMVGVDTCKQQLAPNNYLTSATKDVQGEVLKAAESVAGGTFMGGLFNEGLDQGAVGVCQTNFSSLPQNIQSAVTAAEAKIKSGAVVVPTQ